MRPDNPAPENAAPGTASTDPWVDIGNAWASIVASWGGMAEGWIALMNAWARASTTWMGPYSMGMNPFTVGTQAAASWARQAMDFAASYTPPGSNTQARGRTPQQDTNPGDTPPRVDRS